MSSPSTLASSLRAAERRHVADQLPSLGLAVTAGAIVWFALTALVEPLPLGTAVGIVAFQGVVFAGAAALARRDQAERALPIALGACILTGVLWVLLCMSTTTMAATLTLSALAGFGAAPLVLGWGTGPQVVFQGALTLAWGIFAAVLPRRLLLADQLVALASSNLFGFVMAEWAARGWRVREQERLARLVIERELARSRDAYRALAENAADFIWAVDLDGRWTYVNETLARRCGLTVDAMVGRPVVEVLTPHPGNPVPVELIARLRAGDTVERQLLQMTTPEGPCWVEARATPVRDATGAVIGAQGVSRDVTEQRLAEMSLRESEHRFRTFAESMAAGVLISQPQGIVYVNGAVATITGYTREELLGMHVWDLMHPDERASARKNVGDRLAGTRTTPRVEYRVQTKSGETRWVDITVTIIELDGETAMLGVAFDVTEKKAAEQALRASEARYRGLVESQRDIVLRFDERGIVTFANEAYLRTSGLRLDEAIGRPFWPLVHPEDHERLRLAVLETLQPPYRSQVETRLRTALGWRWIEWEACGIVDARGVVMEGQAAGRDVTERRKAQDALRKSLDDLRRSEQKLRLLAQRQAAVDEEERKRLSFDLHDDVCQELVGVGILVEAALSRLGAMPAESARELTRATGSLNDVVDHLRLLARDLRPMALRELGLESSLRSLASLLSTDATAVEAVFPTPIPRFPESVEVAVYRIAQEAVTNAIHHAQARRVTIRLGVRNDRLLLQVSDDGRGFDTAASDRYAVGLTSMEERAQALAGRLEIRSARGAGTTIVFESPAAQHAPGPAA